MLTPVPARRKDTSGGRGVSGGTLRLGLDSPGDRFKLRHYQFSGKLLALLIGPLLSC